ncbi:uncharacterized protein LOC113521769 [Galleria mellonella]|uniref:Uncharacterized protein LOC113521769 n=1 Tax=Galleria mellonella TaxID=7137 RepID=A0ABM3MWG4_GALME|nr:uncharacterized protein LOC113521769 [Galleria mellonella]
MANWTTQLQLKTLTATIQTIPIKIQRGIFQGDALSPLWFCLALNPLSNMLNSSSVGYPLNYKETDDQSSNMNKNVLNHLLYMDDIKLYAETENQLNQLTKIVEQFTNDIKMEFGLEKCKINSIRAGSQHPYNNTLESGEQITSLSEQEVYKYLGYNQALFINHKEIKLKLQQQFRHRLNAVLKTQLNSRNMIKAINTYAIPILTYSFGIINWTKSDLKSLQRTININMTKHRKHHPRSCIQRLTLPRKEGGRGLIDIVNLHNTQISSLRQYFFSKMESSALHKSIVQNDNKLTPLNLKDGSTQTNETLVNNQTKLTAWSEKSLHGRHRHDLCQSNVDKEASNAWLSRGILYPETEGFIIAIQDQVIETRNYQKYITKTLTSDTCRKCNSSPETIQHITGSCKAIVQTDYKHRHDQVANIIHQNLAHKYNLIQNTHTPYYKYTPQTVLESATYKLYFDRAILTDKTIHYNRPDIILQNKTNKITYLIDIAVPNTHNIQKTIAEKISKYTELKDEITRLWKQEKVYVIPIVLSTTGVIPKHLHHSLKEIDLRKTLYTTLQKAVSCLLALAGEAFANPPATLSYVPISTIDKVSDPSYRFNYAVNDPTTGDNKGQWEARTGDVVHGGYSLVEPDGNVRVVEYTADPLRGFNAVVKRTGPNIHSVALPVAAPITPVITKPIASGPIVAPAPIVASAPIVAPAPILHETITPIVHAPVVSPIIETAPLITPIDVLPLLHLPAPSPWVSISGTKYGAKGNIVRRWAAGPISLDGKTLTIRTKH